MKIITTGLSGVVIVEPPVFGDARGSFSETFSENWSFADRDTVGCGGVNDGVVAGGMEGCGGVNGGWNGRFVQDNESRSVAGVVRGLHFQKPPRAQAKLVRVSAGAILDVAVDMRGGSPTFGRWVAVELSAENGRQLFIPHGFAHGFRVLRVGGDGFATVAYKVDDFYAPECDGGVLWNDPALGIDWGVGCSVSASSEGYGAGYCASTGCGFDPSAAIVSDKDAALPLLAEAFRF